MKKPAKVDTFKLSNSKSLKVIVSITLILFLLSILSISVISEGGCKQGEVYVQGIGCYMPKIKVTQKVIGIDNDKTLAQQSSTFTANTVEALKIFDPFVSAGGVTRVEFTLENNGDEHGYPFNYISLPPDQYTLVLGIDKDPLMLYLDSDGDIQKYDLFQKMSGWEKFKYMVRSSFSQSTQKIIDSGLQGKTCLYVDVSEHISDKQKNKFKQETGQDMPSVVEWECMKIVDEGFFNDKVSNDCAAEKSINAKCISTLLNKYGKRVSSEAVIRLTSDAPGICTYEDNTYKCGIGKDGLCPKGNPACDGPNSIKLVYYILVPADTPSISPISFQKVKEDLASTETEGHFAVTTSSECKDDDFRGACHTLYAGVYSVPHKTLLGYLGGTLSLCAAGGAVGSILGPIGIFGGCVAGVITAVNLGDVDYVGDPIYEAKGTFYSIAPSLKATAVFILWLFAIAGAGLTATYGLGKK